MVTRDERKSRLGALVKQHPGELLEIYQLAAKNSASPGVPPNKPAQSVVDEILAIEFPEHSHR